MTRALSHGMSLVEVVVGAAIAAVVVAGIATAWSFYGKLANESVRTTQADLLIEEGAEALQYWRDKGWDANIGALALNTPYYIVWNGTDYVATTVATPINSSYTRSVTFSAVYRDASDNIASSGTLDAGTRLATISVSLYPTPPGGSATTIMQAQTLIHDIFEN
jgi:hypothetical protein